ncbi:MAG: hypothetical protein ACYDCJ_12950 [Gammaproteobacteria bacterium]
MAGTAAGYSGNTNMVPPGQRQLIAPPTVAPPPATGAPAAPSAGKPPSAVRNFGPIGQRRTRYGTWTSSF